MRMKGRTVPGVSFRILASAKDHPTDTIARAVESFSRSGAVKPGRSRAWIVRVFVAWRYGLVRGFVVGFAGNKLEKGRYNIQKVRELCVRRRFCLE